MRICGGQCVNTDTDPRFCGDCATNCDIDQVCVMGNCRNYFGLAACTSCPCMQCTMGSCCPAPGGGSVPVCVEGRNCP
jgi:hypothetical protein